MSEVRTDVTVEVDVLMRMYRGDRGAWAQESDGGGKNTSATSKCRETFDNVCLTVASKLKTKQ